MRLERMSKAMISLIQDNGKSGRNLKRARAGYKPKNLLIKQLAQYTLRNNRVLGLYFIIQLYLFTSRRCNERSVCQIRRVSAKRRNPFSAPSLLMVCKNLTTTRRHKSYGPPVTTNLNSGKRCGARLHSKRSEGIMMRIAR